MGLGRKAGIPAGHSGLRGISRMMSNVCRYRVQQGRYKARVRELRKSKVVKDTGFETSRPQFKSSFVTGMWQILSFWVLFP